MTIALALGILVADVTNLRSLTTAGAQSTAPAVPLAAGTVVGPRIVARAVSVNGVPTNAVFLGSVEVVDSLLVGDRVRAFGVHVGDNLTTKGVHVGDNVTAKGVHVGDNVTATGVHVGDNAMANGVHVGDNATVTGGSVEGDNVQVVDGVITGENLRVVGAVVDAAGAIIVLSGEMSAPLQ